MTKPDPMAEDSWDSDYDIQLPDGSWTSLAAYTTNKIIEELERLRVEASKNCDAYNADYYKELSAELVKRLAELKALNHRKEKE